MDHDVLEWVPTLRVHTALQSGGVRSGGAAPAKQCPPAQSSEKSAAAHDIQLARQRLRATMARTAVPPNVQPRIIAFDRGLLIAARLAQKLDPVLQETAAANAAPTAQALGMPELVALAHRGLDAGHVDEGLAVLASVGMLLGGPPRAAFETALGLVRIKQPARACERLREAIEGMNDTEGFMSALLAQLWYEAGDLRWVAAARRVLASGTDRDARTRCMELLSTRPGA